MTDDPSRKQDRAWRRAHGLTGFRQVRPGVYERQVMDQRLRKGILRGLPPDSLVMMLVQGDDPLGLYGERRRALVWRNMSLAKRPSRVTGNLPIIRSQVRHNPWMLPQDMLSVWDRRVRDAQNVLRHPRRWLIRVVPRS